MAELTSKSLNAAPTNFHKWLGELHNMGKLLRVYTQNIDGLEMKAGLATYPNQQAGPRMQTSSNCCISLHGSLQRLRCISCSDTFLTETYIDLLHQGVFPRCSTCIKSAKIRQLEAYIGMFQCILSKSRSINFTFRHLYSPSVAQVCSIRS